MTKMSDKIIISKEFFGGIIKDKKTWSNTAIDTFLYDFFAFIKQKLTAEEFYNKYNNSIDSKELLEILEDFLKYKYIESNYEIKDDIISNNNLSAPLRIFYDITYLCNLQCKHCFTRSGKINKNELTLDEKFNLIRQCAKIGVNRISIAGGEPFACKDLFPFIEECNIQGLGVSITTNGTLLNRDVVEKLNNLDIKTLTVSFDGGTEESMDFIRGKGSYRKTIDGLKNLQKYYKGNYSIKTTLMKNNINQLENIIELAIEVGCNSIKFNCVRQDGRASDNSNEIVLTADEYINTIKHIEVLKERYKEIKIKGPLNIFSKEPYDFIQELGFGCFAGKESLCIDPLGNIRPCSHFPKEFICGNIKDDSLYEIWNNSRILKDFRRDFGNSKCNSCDFYGKCRGGCRYRAFCNGNILGVDPYCYLRGEQK